MMYLFFKTIDVSNIKKDATSLCSLFVEVIVWIEYENVVQIIIDIIVNYKKAEELLHERYGNICWSSCGAYFLNLNLKYIIIISNVTELAENTSNMIISIYNHIFILTWL